MNPHLPPPQTPNSRSPPIRTPSPQRWPDTPSPRRRATISQDSRADWSFASFASSRAPSKQTDYEDVVRLLDTVASATLEEKTLTDTYERRIRELESENAELLKENEQLLGLLDSADRGPSVQAAKALATVRTLQEMLVGEREAFAERETGLTRRLWGLESAVKESVGDLLRERRVREELEWRVWPKGRREEEEECAVCMAREEEEEGRAGKGVVERAEAEQRAEEVKVVEEKLEVANAEIRRLQKEVKTLSMLKSHKEDSEAEAEMLKEGMKRIERIAMMYGPLEDELGLLNAIETWKVEFLAASTKRKKRRKKEEKHGLG